MRILAFDTALGACSVAIWAHGRLCARAYESRARGHAEVLLPMIEAVRREAHVGFDGLDRVAVTIGPGSFAGTRVGLAAARGIALARGLSVIGVTTLEAVAFGLRAEPDRPVVAVFDAYRAELYVQVFGPGLDPITAPAALAPDEAAKLVSHSAVLLAGNGATHLAIELERRGIGCEIAPNREQPDAALVAALAAQRGPSSMPPGPLYLRPPDARLPNRPE